MRDMPLVLNVFWGKVRRHFAPGGFFPTDKVILDPEKKEEPRGNGARRERKT